MREIVKEGTDARVTVRSETGGDYIVLEYYGLNGHLVKTEKYGPNKRINESTAEIQARQWLDGLQVLKG